LKLGKIVPRQIDGVMLRLPSHFACCPCGLWSLHLCSHLKVFTLNHSVYKLFWLYT